MVYAAGQQQPQMMMMQSPGQPQMMQQMPEGMQVQPGQQVVYVQAPMNVEDSYPKDWPEEPVKVTCKKCGKTGLTNVEHEPGALAWVLCVILFLIGCWLGCCLIPFCIPALNDQKHKCASCDKKLGKRKSM